MGTSLCSKTPVAATSAAGVMAPKTAARATDTACAAAAKAISEADVLLLCTGAGFSADSGLAVYDDVAQVPAYKERGLSYQDLCHPRWLHDDPSLFWGFWGQCYNDYRCTAPHDGYAIIDDWAEKWFRKSEIANRVRVVGAELAAIQETVGIHADSDEPYTLNDFAGAFFAFTSNVDGHHYDWFRACEIRECHGNIELFQCAASRRACKYAASVPLPLEQLNGDGGPRGCGDAIWRAPCGLRFQVEPNTLMAPATTVEPMIEEGSDSDVEDEPIHIPKDEPIHIRKPAGRGTRRWGRGRERMNSKRPRWSSSAALAMSKMAEKATLGKVRGGGRPHALRYMPEKPTSHSVAASQSFSSNRPTCPCCGGPARPAILMFGDQAWNDVSSQRRRWNIWLQAVQQVAAEMAAGPSGKNGGPVLRPRRPLKAVVLEIGCGNRVATVRRSGEAQLRALQKHGASACLIRVNPDVSTSMTREVGQDAGNGAAVPALHIQAGGLDTLLKIHAIMAEDGAF